MTGFTSKKILTLALACVLTLPIALLQAQKTPEKANRKKVYSVEPDYPEMLKRSNIGGVVRLLIVVSPRGTVDTVNQLGGNAALVEAATNAVKKWRYAPADAETTQEVSITFDPHSDR